MTQASRSIAKQRSKTVTKTVFRDASLSLETGRVMARAWSEQVRGDRRQPAIWAFVSEAVSSYVQETRQQGRQIGNITPLSLPLSYILDTSAAELAKTIGRAAASFPMETACYQLSACYTAMLPQDVRSAWGAYYTPPALTDRLIDLAEEAGTDWATAKALDPACGGGAFLLPVALKMQEALNLEGRELLAHFAGHLKGFEIDPFAAWLTQVWLEIAFSDVISAAGQSFPQVVQVGDSLKQAPEAVFDLVIGNPPYGRVKLDEQARAMYRRGLFGHANLYGLFTDLALRWTRLDGVIAYVTPTSFLAGEYFKALRSLLAQEAPPLAMDFVTARRGVFDDVLQETMLSTYRKGGLLEETRVHFLAVNGKAEVTEAGRFTLPTITSGPWLAPRHPADSALVDKLTALPCRLEDWGYKVSTGPMVWNRFKCQFRAKASKDTFPVIWAEAVSPDGRFGFKAEKRNHLPFFRPGPADGWLKVTQSCVLLQRTTAKEQARRLIAAELPESFIKAHGAVIVENHLNMIKPLGSDIFVSPAVVAAIMNSHVVDRAFRCISGSVAVSAFELEALPLPSVGALGKLEKLVSKGASRAAIEAEIARLYEIADA
jgi:adenine-specific DNA-methyltransferase